MRQLVRIEFGNRPQAEHISQLRQVYAVGERHADLNADAAGPAACYHFCAMPIVSKADIVCLASTGWLAARSFAGSRWRLSPIGSSSLSSRRKKMAHAADEAGGPVRGHESYGRARYRWRLYHTLRVQAMTVGKAKGSRSVVF
jgi:hypothetical protein